MIEFDGVAEANADASEFIRKKRKKEEFKLEHPPPPGKIGRYKQVKGKRNLVRSIVEGPGIVLWEGKGLFDEDEDIVVIANGFKMTSANRKTGSMIQVYIINANLPPWQSIKEGWDEAVCGDCRLRPQLPEGKGRACYVQVWPYVETIWKAYQRASYEDWDDVLTKAGREGLDPDDQDKFIGGQLNDYIRRVEAEEDETRPRAPEDVQKPVESGK